MAEKRPVSEIMATLKTDGPALIKENVALAKAEIKPAVKHAGIGGGMFAGAGYFAVIGANMMWLCGAFALTLAWHAAVSSILLALVLVFASAAVALFLIAGVVALIGKAQVSKVQPPRQSVEEAKRTVGTLKSAVSRGVDNAGATNEISA